MAKLEVDCNNVATIPRDVFVQQVCGRLAKEDMKVLRLCGRHLYGVVRDGIKTVTLRVGDPGLPTSLQDAFPACQELHIRCPGEHLCASGAGRWPNVKGLKELKRLTIHRTSSEHWDLKPLLELVAQVVQLKHLKLGGGYLGHGEMEAIGNLSSLVELQLLSVPREAASLHFLSSLTLLTSLKVARIPIPSGTAPTSTGAPSWMSLGTLPALSKLHFHSHLPGPQWVELLGALCVVRTIRHLDLSYSNVGDEELGMLEEMRGVEVLNLRSCRKVTNESLPVLACLSRLTKLYLEETKVLVDRQVLALLTHCKQLREVYLPGLFLDLHHLLQDPLPSHPAVQVVALHGNDPVPRVMGLLTWCHPATLHIDAAVTDVTIEGIVNMHKAGTGPQPTNPSPMVGTAQDGADPVDAAWGPAPCQSLSSSQQGPQPLCLTGLHLTNCYQLTSSGIAAVGQIATLTTLSLLNCVGISDYDLAALADGLTRLSSLSLKGCSMLTNVGLLRLLNLRKLRGIDLESCDSISDFGVVTLATLPLLEKLTVKACDKTTSDLPSEIYRFIRERRLLHVKWSP